MSASTQLDERCHGGRGAHRLRALRRRCCHRRALRAARGRRLGGRPAVLGLPGGRRRRRRRLVHRRLRRHRSGATDPSRRSVPTSSPSCVAWPGCVGRRTDASSRRTTSPCSRRGTALAGDRGGAGARRLRARRRRARVPLAARAVAGRAVAHRGRGPDARRRSRRSSGSPPTASRPWPTARARVCGRRTSSSTCRTRSTRAAGRVAGKLGSYVRGGLGTRETAQVEAHLEDCGTCRGLLLELGDVNHGMRAVIAPLVLGLLGLGALGVALPVGGGLAAGAAAAAAAGCRRRRCGGAGAGGVAAGGAAAGRCGGDRDGGRRGRRSDGGAVAVRPRPVAWRRSWPRSRSVSLRRSWAAWRSPRSPRSAIVEPARVPGRRDAPRRSRPSSESAEQRPRRRRPAPTRPRRRSRPTSRRPSPPTCRPTTSSPDDEDDRRTSPVT